MKIEKHIIGLVLLILFMGVGYADGNNANVKSSVSSSKSKIVYGSVDNVSEIRQKDIDALIKKWYTPKVIKLVWVLYKILDANDEYPNKDTFKEMLKLQTNSWITISYLVDDLWVSDEVIKKIKTNDYLISWLWIDINWKTLFEEYKEAHAKNQASHAKNQASHAKNQASHAKNQAEWTWKEINAKNQEINNIALWH